jgi:hypothetical protein
LRFKVNHPSFEDILEVITGAVEHAGFANFMSAVVLMDMTAQEYDQDSIRLF